MKRERQIGPTVWTFPNSPVEYVLNLDYRKAASTIARLRAELRRKDKEIRRIAAFIETARSGQLPPSPGAVLHQARAWLLAALKKPTRRKKR